MWAHRRDTIVTGDLSTAPMDSTDPYMQWYHRITRRLVGPPIARPTIGFQPVGSIIELLEETLTWIYHTARGTYEGSTDLTRCMDVISRITDMSSSCLTVLREHRRLDAASVSAEDVPSTSAQPLPHLYPKRTTPLSSPSASTQDRAHSPTPAPTPTPTPTAAPTLESTLTPTPAAAPPSGSAVAHAPTPTHAPTSALPPTSAPASVSAPTLAHSPTLTQAPIPTLTHAVALAFISTTTSTSTSTSTPTPTPTSTSTPTPAPALDHTPTPALAPISPPASTPTPTMTSTPTPTPSLAPTLTAVASIPTSSGQSLVSDPLLDEEGVTQDPTVVGVGLVRAGPRVRGGRHGCGWGRGRGRAQHPHHHDDVGVSQVT